MQGASRYDHNPPPSTGRLRAIGLALLIHGLLLAALTWGVSWRSSDTSLSVEAELWAAVPQQAAPRAVAPEPPPPEPKPEPEPAPPPPPPPKAQEPRNNEAEIALARERERKQKLEQERLERERLAREKREREERERLEREKKLAEEKRRKELEAKRREEAEARQREQLRQEQLKRMAGLAGATGSAQDQAQRAAGPSAGYAGRIRARIKPNIVFTEELASNPVAEVEVRTSPDGTIVGRKLLKSSGHKAWDEAVLKAIDKTETLPRDIDGLVPSTLVITFRPRD